MTVVTHELGHVLGETDVYVSAATDADEAPAAESRPLPLPSSAYHAIDDFFSGLGDDVRFDLFD